MMESKFPWSFFETVSTTKPISNRNRAAPVVATDARRIVAVNGRRTIHPRIALQTVARRPGNPGLSQVQRFLPIAARGRRDRGRTSPSPDCGEVRLCLQPLPATPRRALYPLSQALSKSCDSSRIRRIFSGLARTCVSRIACASSSGAGFRASERPRWYQRSSITTS